MTNEERVALALRLGAKKAVILDVSQVVLNASFRDICASNGCGQFGKCWVCPPYAGPIEELMADLRKRQVVLWYQTIFDIEDSFDFEGMQEAKKQHIALCQALQAELRANGEADFLHLGAGGCGLCERCACPGSPCRFPDKAMSSLEAYGVDVFSTTKNTPLHYINGADTVTYFGGVFF